MDRNMRIAFYTLGCKVNQYETQALKEAFKKRGFTIVDEQDESDIYVVNTCTVTNLADRKSRQYIRRMKRRNPESIVAVIGCYAQVNPAEATAIEGVNLVIGNNEKKFLPEYIGKLLENRKNNALLNDPLVQILERDELGQYPEWGTVTSMESRTRAYVKIQDGCDKFCSYCIIPYARGPIRSRNSKEIVREAESLLKKGFKELILTGINTALYGMEKSGKTEGIESIVKEINQLPGDFRIRLGSLEPNVVDAALAERLLEYDKLCHHMHLSLQSGSDKILKAMNRSYNRDIYLDIVNALRKTDSSYGISTDVIVGFPGESDEDFKDSAGLVKQVGFVKTHVFPYSKRQGTKAAEMKGQIDGRIKKERSLKLADVARESAHAFLKTTIGEVRQVLFEEYEGKTGMVAGYSDNYVKVYFKTTKEKGHSMVNTLQKVEFTGIYGDGVSCRCI